MNKSEKFIKEFRKNFRFLFGKKVVIYGIGINTATIINNITEMEIIGLLDRDKDNIGKIIFGKKVISAEEAMCAEAIIIVTLDPCYWQQIYQRIYELTEKNQVPVYYTNGERASIDGISKDVTENEYWNKTSDRMKQRIDEADVISFDVFDTLIMRKVFYPSTIFALMELQYKQKYGKELSLMRIRKYAEIELVQKGNPTPTYSEIYQYVQEKLKLSNDEKEYLAELEIDFEEKLLVPRQRMVELFDYAKAKGKEVYLISDMYLGKAQIKRFLQLCGIEGETQLLVSVEEKAKKSDGLLWDIYSKKVQGRKALHFGDDMCADIENAEKRGILTEQIYSAREMLSNSSLKALVADICSVHEEVTMGLIIAKIFNDPFALSESKGIVEWNSHETLGYAVYATPIYNYLIWLMQKAKEEGMDDILFFARDGYVLEKVYSYIKDTFCFNDIPRGIYFHISRMLGAIWSIYSEEDIDKILKNGWVGKFKDFMLYRFYVSVNDSHSEEEVYASEEFEKVKSYMAPYIDEIIKGAKEQRERFLHYVKELDLGNFCISDPSYRGTNQYYLSKLLNKKFKGYYMYANLDEEDNSLGQIQYMEALYQSKEDKKAKQSCLNMNSTQFENGILVAPEGGCIGIDSEGKFVKTPEVRTQKEFYYKEWMLKGVIDYIADMSICYKGLSVENMKYVDMYADKMFGEMIGVKCRISEEVKNTMYVDTFYTTIFERKMWE